MTQLINETGHGKQFFDLEEVKRDFLSVVEKLPDEVPYLRLAIIQGKIHGEFYQGECACLKGTLASRCANHVFKTGAVVQLYLADEFGITTSLQDSPVEQFFYHIKKGDTPWNNPYSEIALEWCDEFLLERAKAQAPQLAGVIG